MSSEFYRPSWAGPGLMTPAQAKQAQADAMTVKLWGAAVLAPRGCVVCGANHGDLACPLMVGTNEGAR